VGCLLTKADGVGSVGEKQATLGIYEPPATLVFNASSETVGSIASSGTDGTINLGANTLTTGGNNQTTSYGGAITGTGSLTKVSTGTMTLAGATTYNGTTTVTEGGLIIDAANASALVDVASGARVGGDGIINGNLNLVSGANFIFSDTMVLDVVGTVTLTSGFGVASLVAADGGVVNWGLVAEGTYTLIGNTTSDYTGISNFGILNQDVLGGGKNGYFETTVDGLGLVVVPEPQVWALIAIGLASVFFFRLRRRSA